MVAFAAGPVACDFDGAAWLPSERVRRPRRRYPLAFVLVFVAAVFGVGLVAALTRKLITAVGPAARRPDHGWRLRRGVGRGLPCWCWRWLFHFLALSDSAWWHESRSAMVLDAALQGLKPALPEKLASYLP